MCVVSLVACVVCVCTAKRDFSVELEAFNELIEQTEEETKAQQEAEAAKLADMRKQAEAQQDRALLDRVAQLKQQKEEAKRKLEELRAAKNHAKPTVADGVKASNGTAAGTEEEELESMFDWRMKKKQKK